MTVSIIIVIGKQMENCSSSKLSHLSRTLSPASFVLEVSNVHKGTPWIFLFLFFILC